MGEAIAFYFIAACILGFAVLVVTTKDTVHSVLFLVLDFLFVAALYVLLGAPFDLPEAEQELTGGFHTEYSGMRFALFFLAEYANMILIAALASTFFLGGWLSPFEGYPVVGDVKLLAAPGLHWLVLKMMFFLFCFLWFRATFPRYRYDQIMRLGWKALIPVTIVWIFVEGVLAYLKVGPWAH